jgi:hypothetical protein
VPPACPRRGKRERGRSKFFAAAGQFFTPPSADDLAGELRFAPWAAAPASCAAPSGPPHAAQTALPLCHRAAHTRGPCNPPACSASGSFRFAECGYPVRWCCPDSPVARAGSRTPRPDPSATCAQTRCLFRPQPRRIACADNRSLGVDGNSTSTGANVVRIVQHSSKPCKQLSK